MVGINYGGKDEIIRAIKKLFISHKEEKSITAELFSTYLDTSDIPPPDLVVRTGKEQRLSGFMMWQSEYSELVFPDIYFPDFTKSEFEKAVAEFTRRKRRFGK